MSSARSNLPAIAAPPGASNAVAISIRAATPAPAGIWRATERITLPLRIRRCDGKRAADYLG